MVEILESDFIVTEPCRDFRRKVIANCQDIAALVGGSVSQGGQWLELHDGQGELLLAMDVDAMAAARRDQARGLP